MPNCELCGEPMPVGEEVFNYHGYSGPCPKLPLQGPPPLREDIAWLIERGQPEGQTPPMWWMGNCQAVLEWTEDALLAQRYPTREAAEEAIAVFHTPPVGPPNCHASEHLWMSRAPKEETVRVTAYMRPWTQVLLSDIDFPEGALVKVTLLDS